jgi:Alcohol dehydrogenase GroES-like domain
MIDLSARGPCLSFGTCTEMRHRKQRAQLREVCMLTSKEPQMKALTWHGKGDVRCEQVPDPTIEHPRDAIIKVTACAICGSDLHLFDGVMPEMEKGDVLGHETMGEGRRGRSRKQVPKYWRPRGRALHHFLRRMLLLPARLLLRLRAHQSRSRQGGEDVGSFPRRLVRLFAHVGRLCRWPSAVSAGSLCGCRSYQGAGRTI